MAVKQLEEQFERSPLIKRYQRIAWILPLIIVVASIILSIQFSSWEHFSRAGSLIVVVGIYIAIKDLSGAIYERAGNNYFTMSEFLEVGDIGQFEKGVLDELIGKAKTVEKIHKDNKKFANYASRKFRRMEATLLAGGTLMWGYGDLVLNLIWKFNA